MATELEKTSSSSNLPPELIEVILSKSSSVKSLLRFKSVSKSWNTMISDPVFVRNHLQSSISANNLFLKYTNDHRDRGGLSLVKLEGRKFHVEAVLEKPYRYLKILCECNGVLLLNYDCCTKYVLWNPSTQQSMYFKSPYYHPTRFYLWNHGICYDPITDDFKVIVITTEEFKNFKIYSCKNNSWTEKELITPYCGLGSAIFVDGATYWLFYSDSYGTIQIVYFDPKMDELKTLQKPTELNDTDGMFRIRSIAALRGSLCLYCMSRTGGDNTVKIWIKEKGIFENCWNEFMFITFHENCSTRNLWTRPLCFVENKIVIRLEEGRRFLCYSPSENTFEEFEDIAIGLDDCKIVPYRNSLYFPLGV